MVSPASNPAHRFFHSIALSDQVEDVIESLKNHSTRASFPEELLQRAVELQIEAFRSQDHAAITAFYKPHPMRHELSGRMLNAAASMEPAESNLWRQALNERRYIPTTPKAFLQAAVTLQLKGRSQWLAELNEQYQLYPTKFSFQAKIGNDPTSPCFAEELMTQNKPLEQCSFADFVEAWDLIYVADASQIERWIETFCDFIRRYPLPLLP